MNKDKLIKDMDHELWTKFRSKCILEGVKITDILQDFIKEYIGDKK